MRDRADEMDIVTDENQRPLVLLKRANERVDRADIEVRRRLVHQEKIRRVEQNLHQREPRFFPAAEHADRFENVVAFE